MEVHAHTHTERKKWTHYFWEFLMLFLAVFCGFLAENQREHMVEHQREKKYMITLLEDLVIDTAALGKLELTVTDVISRKDSLRQYLKPPITEKMVIPYILESLKILTLRGFTYNGRTVEQLRSSGNYRLIRKKNVTDSLIEYDTRMRGTFTKNYTVVYESRFKLIDLQNDILDHGIFDTTFIDEKYGLIKESLKKSNLWPLHLLTDDPKILYHYYNACLAHIAFNLDLKLWIRHMKSRAESLIVLIKKEYHLK